MGHVSLVVCIPAQESFPSKRSRDIPAPRAHRDGACRTSAGSLPTRESSKIAGTGVQRHLMPHLMTCRSLHRVLGTQPAQHQSPTTSKMLFMVLNGQYVPPNHGSYGKLLSTQDAF